MTSTSKSSTRRVVAVIGTGNIGATIARRAAAAGWGVVVTNSRDPRTLDGFVAELGDGASAATPAEAARAADVVVASIPFSAHRSLPTDALDGTVVIDTMNYYPGRDDRIPELDELTATSSELLQRHARGAHVVKAFNNVDFARLAALPRPRGTADRAALPVSGDDAEALTTAVDFLDAVGFDAVVIGSLAASWRQEPGTPVYVDPYSRPDASISDPGQRFFTAEAVALTGEQVLSLVARAVRATPPTFPGA